MFGTVTVLFVSGCCFVTFFTRKSALDAQNALHNIKTLAGVSAKQGPAATWTAASAAAFN